MLRGLRIKAEHQEKGTHIEGLLRNQVFNLLGF